MSPKTKQCLHVTHHPFFTTKFNLIACFCFSFLHAGLLSVAYLLYATPFYPQINQTQVQINQSHVQINQSQFQINQTQFQINQSQFQINQSQFQINQSQFQINQTQFQINQTQFQINQSQFQINQTQFQIKKKHFSIRMYSLYLNNIFFIIRHILQKYYENRYIYIYTVTACIFDTESFQAMVSSSIYVYILQRIYFYTVCVESGTLISHVAPHRYIH